MNPARCQIDSAYPGIMCDLPPSDVAVFFLNNGKALSIKLCRGHSYSLPLIGVELLARANFPSDTFISRMAVTSFSDVKRLRYLSDEQQLANDAAHVSFEHPQTHMAEIEHPHTEHHAKILAFRRKNAPESVTEPEVHDNPARFQRGELVAEILLDRRSGHAVYHYIVQRVGSAEVLEWSHQNTFIEAERMALAALERLEQQEREMKNNPENAAS